MKRVDDQELRELLNQVGVAAIRDEENELATEARQLIAKCFAIVQATVGDLEPDEIFSFESALRECIHDDPAASGDDGGDPVLRLDALALPQLMKLVDALHVIVSRRAQ